MNAPIANQRSSSVNVQTIDVRYYWRLILRFKWLIIGCSITAACVSAYIAMHMVPVYRSGATILVKSDEAKALSIGELYGINNSNKEYFQTQFEILKSRSLVERVVQRLSLDTNPLFDPRQMEPPVWRSWVSADQAPTPLTDEQAFEQTVIAVATGLAIEPVALTQLVKINFESTDKKIAADIANTMASVYIESHMEASLLASKNASDWLASRLDDLNDALKASEAELQAYREQYNLIDVKGVQTLDAEELEQLTQRYVEARKARAEIKTIYEQVRSLGEWPNVEELMTIPSILRHPLVQSLRQNQAIAEQKAAELSKRYGPKHPIMIAAQSEAESTEIQLKRQLTRVASGIENDYLMASETEKLLEKQIADAKGRVQNINRKEFKLGELEREVENNQQIYNMFLTRAKEIGEAGDFQAAHAQIVDTAKPPLTPVKPMKKLIVSLAFLSGGVGVIFLLVFLDLLNNTVRSPDDVEERLGSPLIGFLPLIKSNKHSLPYEGFLSSQDSQFAESVRTIRTGLFLANLEAPQKVIVVTSTLSNEGKSTVALNLAEAIGQMEKVLLIEADLRRPTLSKSLGLKTTPKGVSALVMGEAEWKECIQKLGDHNISVLPAGPIPSNPLEILGSNEFKQTLKRLSTFFDKIIIDSAPIHPVSDGLVLSKLADAVVYVVRADKTPAPIASKSLNRLKAAGAPITGVVLNMVNMKKAAAYGDYYASYHGDAKYLKPDVVSKL